MHNVFISSKHPKKLVTNIDTKGLDNIFFLFRLSLQDPPETHAKLSLFLEQQASILNTEKSLGVCEECRLLGLLNPVFTGWAR